MPGRSFSNLKCGIKLHPSRLLTAAAKITLIIVECLLSVASLDIAQHEDMMDQDMMEQNVQTLITCTNGAHSACHGPAHDAHKYQRRGGTQLHLLPPPPPPPLADLLLPPPPRPPPPELLHPRFMPTLRRSPSTPSGSDPAHEASCRTRTSGAHPRRLRRSRSAPSTRRKKKHSSKRA